MKTILTLLASLLLVSNMFAGPTTTTTTTQTTTASAAPAPEEMLMLSSAAELKLYALSSITSASSFVWGQSILRSVGDVTSIYVEGDVDQVTERLLLPGNQFRFKVRNNNEVYVYATLNNSSGESLFTSYAPAAPIAGGGQLVINPTLRLQMNWVIPVYFPGAQYATIYYTDDQGNSWQENLNVGNGKIYFPVNYAGRGTLVVGRQYPNNATGGYDLEVAYNLTTGALIQSQVIASQVGYVGIENYIAFSDKLSPTIGTLVLTTSMTPPSKDQWGFISPPTGSIKLESTQEGASRPFKLNVSFSCTPQELGTIQAFAYDPTTADADGFVDEFPGVVTTTSFQTPSGTTQTNVTVTWTVTRNTATSKWLWRLETTGFNKQAKPQPPYYGVGKG
ncbi:MAG: hypothetical protein FGM57_01300 [Candidatus Taylorbacteria bacterium]|nr:hypothetical protein [Candidatus Taylorbacteria bacterium]